MRSFIRNIFTGIWILFAIVVGTLFRQNIENFADEAGISSFFKSWYAFMISIDINTWYLLAFVFISGITLTLWVDNLYKKKNKDLKKYPIIRLGYEYFPEDSTDSWHVKLSHWIASEQIGTMLGKAVREKTSDPVLSKHRFQINLMLDIDGCPSYSPHIVTDRPLLWRLTDEGRYHLVFEIDLIKKEPIKIDIYINSEKRLGVDQRALLLEWKESFVYEKHVFFQPQNNKEIGKDIMPVKPSPPFPPWHDIEFKKTGLLSRLLSRISTVIKKLH